MAELFSATTIPHSDQAYPTTGDYYWDRGIEVGPVRIVVSKMGDTRFEQAVAIHELIEATLVQHAGIKNEDIIAFDKAYEAARPVAGIGVDIAPCGCDITDASEPGDDIHAPYYRQHQFATSVERMWLAEAGGSWNEYEAANLALYEDAKE
jgi:hypothetical protein